MQVIPISFFVHKSLAMLCSKTLIESRPNPGLLKLRDADFFQAVYWMCILLREIYYFCGSPMKDN